MIVLFSFSSILSIIVIIKRPTNLKLSFRCLFEERAFRDKTYNVVAIFVQSPQTFVTIIMSQQGQIL